MTRGIKDQYNNTIKFFYSSAGGVMYREDMVVDGTTYTINVPKDRIGRKRAVVHPDGERHNYTYRNNILGGPIKTISRRPAGASSYEQLALFYYDNAGRETKRVFGEPGPGRLATDRVYDSVGRLTSIDNDTHSELDFTYTYDAIDNIASETRGGTMSDSSWTASYDDEQRLTNWDVQTGNDESWQLSAVGNWNSYTSGSQTETRTHGDAHELTGITGGPNAGNITYDNRGNMTSDTNGMTFNWDHDGMLQSVTVPNTSPVGIEGTHTYEYDVLGRRVAKTVNDTPNATTTKTTFVQRLVSLPPLGTKGGQVICEYETVNASPTTLARQYTYGSYVDEPLWQHELNAGEQYTLHQDRRYNVIGVTDTDNTNLLATGTYTGYGTGVFTPIAAGQDASVEKVVQSFTGRSLDSETEMYFFRRRYFSDSLARFISRDPLEYFDSEVLYSAAFCPDSLDPSGEAWIIPILIALIPCSQGMTIAALAEFASQVLNGNFFDIKPAFCGGVGGCIAGLCFAGSGAFAILNTAFCLGVGDYFCIACTTTIGCRRPWYCI